MLHVLQRDAAPMADNVLKAMFAARKSVFVDLLKWDVPVIGGAYELDQFDDTHARYLVLTDDAGAHLGSARLLPTMRPHILDSLYPQLCAQLPPKSARAWEITRFCLDRRLSAAERRSVRDTLVVSLAEHALANGIDVYSAVAEMGWFQQVLAFGWRCRPLGLPQMVDRTTLIALRIEIDADTPALLAGSGISASSGIIANPIAAAA